MTHPKSLTNITPPTIVVIEEGVDPRMLPISITALDDAVSLVHIPISAEGEEDEQLSRVYWTIEQAISESEEFFNITSNRIEVAIFAAKELISREWAAAAEGHTDVRMSEGWKVFEINSGDVGDDNSGNYDSPHLRYVSAPLAKAGISILYQSSYHADFLMVKEADFELASDIFAAHGWTINATSNPSPRHSLSSPIPSAPPTPSTPRPRSALSNTAPYSTPPLTAINPTTGHPSSPPGHLTTPLPSPLAFVGFHRSSPNFQLHTGLVQKYLTWPLRCRTQYVTPPTPSLASSPNGGIAERPFISYTRTQDGASLVTEVKVIRGMFRGLEEGMMCGDEMGEGEEGSGSDVGWSTEDEGVSGDEGGGGSETERDSGTDVDEGQEEDQDTPRASPYPPRKEHPGSTSPGGYFVLPAPGPARRRPAPLLSHQQLHRPPFSDDADRPRPRHRKTQSVPATPGPLELEAGFELASPESAGRRVAKRRSTPGRGLSLEGHVRGGASRKLGPEERKEREEQRKKGRKICIQLDMSGVGVQENGSTVYHLDKSGLVTRFSTLLQQANIRMLYSSTFHTANILVEAKDVRTARRLLAGIK